MNSVGNLIACHVSLNKEISCKCQISEISLDKDTWHAVRFPTLFINLHEIPEVKDTWHVVKF